MRVNGVKCRLFGGTRVCLFWVVCVHRHNMYMYVPICIDVCMPVAQAHVQRSAVVCTELLMCACRIQHS